MQPGHHDIALRYHETSEHLIHREHTIELRFDPGSELEFDGEYFSLDQLHFHTPSEHLIDHQRFPVELHLVHRSADETLLVLGLLFEVGEANSVIEQILVDAPHDLGKVDLNRQLGIVPLFPDEKHFYAYKGSLTTAPYTEGVQWLILSEHPSISADQVVRLLVMEGGNARSVQPINDRLVEGQ
jgi:carbonic anhydrase